jgi:cholesterol oxidase
MSGAISSLEFTEKMRGRVRFGVVDPREGARPGPSGARLMFRLTIEVVDVDRFVVDPELAAVAHGYVRCDALGGQLPVERGVFNLFVTGDDPNERRMHYRLWFRDGAGHRLTLVGHKEVHDDRGFDLWSDTTTLFVRLLRGHLDPEADAGAEVSAAGVLRIRPLDFAWQLTTFRARGPHVRAKLRALMSFGRIFLGNLWQVYGPTRSRRRVA